MEEKVSDLQAFFGKDNIVFVRQDGEDRPATKEEHLDFMARLNNQIIQYQEKVKELIDQHDCIGGSLYSLLISEDVDERVAFLVKVFGLEE